ncbi:unnamed protein product, partial [Didymodactylos carnosus]
LSGLLKKIEKNDIDFRDTKSHYENLFAEQVNNVKRLVKERELLNLYIKRLETENHTLTTINTDETTRLLAHTVQSPTTIEEAWGLLQKLREQVINQLKVEHKLRNDLQLLHNNYKADIREREQIENLLNRDLNTAKDEIIVLQSIQTEYERITGLKNDLEKQLDDKLNELNITKTVATALTNQLKEKLDLLSKTKSKIEEENVSLRVQIQKMKIDLDNSELVQRDFVKLSQSLQVQLEIIRESEHVLRWHNEEDYHECMNCKTPFTVTWRKHHCRHCGKVLCKDCTNKTVYTGPNNRASRAKNVLQDVIMSPRKTCQLSTANGYNCNLSKGAIRVQSVPYKKSVEVKPTIEENFELSNNTCSNDIVLNNLQQISSGKTVVVNDEDQLCFDKFVSKFSIVADSSITNRTRTPLKLLGPDEIPLIPDAPTNRAPSLQPVWYSEQTLIDNEEVEEEQASTMTFGQRQSSQRRQTIKPEQPILTGVRSAQNEDEYLIKITITTPTISSSSHCSSPTTVSSNSMLNDSSKENRNLPMVLEAEPAVCVQQVSQHEDSFSRLEKQFNEECFGSLNDRTSHCAVLKPVGSEEMSLLTRSQTYSVFPSIEHDILTASDFDKSTVKNEKQLSTTSLSLAFDSRWSQSIELLTTATCEQQKEEELNEGKEEMPCSSYNHLTPINSNDALQLTAITPADIINTWTTSTLAYTSPRKMFAQTLEAIVSMKTGDEQAKSTSLVVCNTEEDNDKTTTRISYMPTLNSLTTQNLDGVDNSCDISHNSEKVSGEANQQINLSLNDDQNLIQHIVPFSHKNDKNESSYHDNENTQEKSDDESLNIIQTIDSELLMRSEQNDKEEEDGEDDANFSFELEQFPSSAQSPNSADQQQQRQSSLSLPPAMCERPPTCADVAYRALLKQPTPRTSLVTNSMSPLARLCKYSFVSNESAVRSSSHVEFSGYSKPL